MDVHLVKTNANILMEVYLNKLSFIDISYIHQHKTVRICCMQLMIGRSPPLLLYTGVS